MTMLNRKPIRIIDNIMDFVIEKDKDSYFHDWERLAQDKKGNITIEFEILQNCCDLLVLNYCHEKDIIKLIDVGCGEGNVINNLKCCEERVALEYSLIRLNAVNDDIIKMRANAEDIPIVSNYFDIVICTDVFEHVINEDKLSSELHRILKPGGMLLFATPWEQDISVYDSKEFRENFTLYECRHRRSVSRETIDNYFSGFDIVGETLIKSQMRFMKLKPYPIIFIEFRKK